MRLRVRNLQDFWSGIFFIALGVLAIYLARDYTMGSALKPGPGYFPTWLGGIMIAFGAVITALVFRLDADPGQRGLLHEWGFGPWVVLPATLAVFALLMQADVG